MSLIHQTMNLFSKNTLLFSGSCVCRDTMKSSQLSQETLTSDWFHAKSRHTEITNGRHSDTLGGAIHLFVCLIQKLVLSSNKQIPVLPSGTHCLQCKPQRTGFSKTALGTSHADSGQRLLNLRCPLSPRSPLVTHPRAH